MSAELEILENGEASMAFTGSRDEIWHRQGKEVPRDLTPEQMMEAAGLNWSVKKVKMRAECNGKPVKGVECYALVRDSDNSMLSIVSNTWSPCQNIEAFEFFNDFVGNGDMEMSTAGSLFNGRHVWAQAKINDGFDLFGGDKVESFFLFSNPHQFGKSIDIRLTMTRVVCNNTITAALNLGSKASIKVNHRKPFDGDEVKMALGIAHEKLMEYKARAEFLGKKKAKHEDVVEYFKRIFPVTGAKEISRNAKKCLDALDTQPGAEFAKGSMWQAFNAVTYVTNHEIGRSEDNRTASVWFGANADLNIKALNLAVEMAS